MKYVAFYGFAFLALLPVSASCADLKVDLKDNTSFLNWFADERKAIGELDSNAIAMSDRIAKDNSQLSKMLSGKTIHWKFLVCKVTNDSVLIKMNGERVAALSPGENNACWVPIGKGSISRDDAGKLRENDVLDVQAKVSEAKFNGDVIYIKLKDIKAE